MYKDCIEFKPQFGMIFQMNDKPELSKVDEAIARSLKVINFPYVFTSNPKAPNHKPVDMTLKTKFEKDVRYHQQFMKILIKYHKKYITQRKALEEPEEVTRETQEYIESNNPVLEWLNTNYEKTNRYDDKITFEEVYTDFILQNNSVSRKHFGSYMKTAGYESKTSNSTRIFRGLKKKNQFIEQDEIDG